MFVSEQLLYTKETKKDTRLMLTIRHCSLLSGQYSVFSDVVMIYPTMYVLKVGDWTLNILFHKLHVGFYLPTHDTTHDSNMFIDGSLFPV